MTTYFVSFARLRDIHAELDTYVDDNPEFDWLLMDVRQKINTWREGVLVPIRFFDDGQAVRFRMVFSEYVFEPI